MDRTDKEVSDKVEVVLESFSFGAEDPRWGGSVDIVRRTMHFSDGTTRVYIDKRLKIGGRYLGLPRQNTEELIEAIRSSEGPANEAHATLMEEIQRTRGGSSRGFQGHQPRPNDRGNDRGRGRKDSREY